MSIPDDDVALSNKMAEVFNDETLRHDYEPPEKTPDTDEQRQPARQEDTGEAEDTTTTPRARDQGRQRQVREQPQSKQQRQRPQAAENGDLVDASGNLVAKAGREREFYEHARRTEHAITQVRVENSQLKQQLSAFKDAWQSYKDAGIPPEEVPSAMALIGRFRREPIPALRDLLTQLQAAGIDTSSVVQGGSTMDPNAIKRIVDDALKPFVQDRQQQSLHQQGMDRARDEYNAFVAQYPHAEANLGTLQQMLQRYPGTSLENMWLRIENWAVKNGLDPSKPFNTQVNGDGATADTPTRGRGLPNGRFPSRGASVSRPQGQQADYTHSSSRDIVRDAMRENGYDV